MRAQTIAKIIILLAALSAFNIKESCAEETKLNIGAILPISGPLAEYGVAVKNGIELAKKENPEVAKNCAFTYEDSRYDSKSAVTAVQKLAAQKIGIIYNWGGPTSEAVAPLAERLKLAMFVWSADPAVSQHSSRVIRFTNSGAEYGGKLAAAIKKAGYRKIGIIRAENQYLDSILKGLKDAAAPELQVEVMDSYLPTEQDFRTSVSKLRNKNYDAFGVFLLSGQVALFYNQLADQKLALPTFGTDFFESLSEVKNAGPSIDGAFFANNEVTERFRTVYQDTYKNDYQINHAANGYDFAAFICRDLAGKKKDLSADEILELAKSAEIDGQQGHSQYSSAAGDKYFGFPVVIRRIAKDKIVSDRSIN
jgi:branched-chain amino acid transport system substrate-binding protein